MKKTRMGIAPDGTPVLEIEANAAEANTETCIEANTGTENQTGETASEATQTAVTQPEVTREPDPRSTEQKISDMRKALEEKQKLMERFSDLQTKHDRFTSAREELTPDDCEVVLNVNGRRFSSTDPQAVNRFISFQIDSYSLEIEKVAALLLA